MSILLQRLRKVPLWSFSLNSPHKKSLLKELPLIESQPYMHYCNQAPVYKSERLVERNDSILQDFPEDTKIKGTTYEFVEGDPANRELLQKAGVAFCDSVIVGGILDGRPAKEADALTITLVMLVQECLAAAGRDESNPAHIVGMVGQFLPLLLVSCM